MVALGRKVSNCDEFNIIFNKELQQLAQCKYRYFGASYLHCNIPAILETMAILAYRPELCIIHNILSHTGLSTKQLGYADFLNQKFFM